MAVHVLHKKYHLPALRALDFESAVLSGDGAT